MPEVKIQQSLICFIATEHPDKASNCFTNRKMQKRPSQMHCGHLNYLTAFCFPYTFGDPLRKSIGSYDAIDSVYKEPMTSLKLFLSSLNNMTASLLQMHDDWLLMGLGKAWERKH